jgi:energy-coupling factor transporter ATP-binding protein EcfA2
LADTVTLSNATYGLDALESLTSQILTDTGTTLPSTISNLRSGVTAVYSSLSDAEATITSDIAAVYSALSDFEASIGSDSAAIAAVYSALSDFEATIVSDVAALPADVADAVWDEAIADHIAAGTFGAIGTQVVLAGTASAGSLTTITLTGGVGTAGYYNGATVILSGGTGIGQSRTILNYAADTVATVTRDWAVAPDNTSKFIVVGADWPAILEAGTAQAGGVATITLDATSSATDDIYKNNFVMITGGTGAGQTRLIGAYNGTSKVATVVPNWTTNPDSTSIYQILPMARVDVAGVAGTLQTSGDLVALISDVDSGILAVDNKVDSILEDTKEINSQCDSILADTGTTLPASISDLLSTIDGAGIKPVTAEPGAGAPGATIPTGEKIDYLYTVFRNKIETTSGTQKVYNDAGAVVLFSCALSDDATTFTKAEHA